MDPDDARVARRAAPGSALSNVRLFPRPGPKLYAGVAWWAFGLYVLFFASAPYMPSPENEQAFSELMERAVFSEDMRMAQQEAMAAQRSLDQVHVWGWRWRPPYDTLVPPRQRAVAEAQSRLHVALREREELQSEAKAQ